MKINKAVFSDRSPSDVWDNLVNDYLPEFDEATRVELDEVSFTFSLLVGLDNQVMNGGVMQFLDNWDGNYFHETQEAARKISSPELIALLEQVAAIFPDKQVPKDWGERRDKIDTLNEQHTIQGEEYDYTTPEWDAFWEKMDEVYYGNRIKICQQTIYYLQSKAILY